MSQPFLSPVRHSTIIASLLLVFTLAAHQLSAKVEVDEPSEEQASAQESNRLLAPDEPPFNEERNLDRDGEREDVTDEAVDPEVQEQFARILDEVREQRIADEAEDFELLKEIEELGETVSTEWRPLNRLSQDFLWEPAMRVVFRKHADNEVSAYWPEPLDATRVFTVRRARWCEQTKERSILRKVTKTKTATKQVTVTKYAKEQRTRTVTKTYVDETGTERQGQVTEEYTVEVPYKETQEIEVEVEYTDEEPVTVAVSVIAPCGWLEEAKEGTCDMFTVTHGVVDRRQLPLYRGDGRRVTWQQFLAERKVGETVGVLLLASREHWTDELQQLLSPTAYVVIADSRTVNPLTSLIESEDPKAGEWVESLPVIARRAAHSDFRFAFSPYVRAMVNGSIVHESIANSSPRQFADSPFNVSFGGIGVGLAPAPIMDVPPGYAPQSEFLQEARKNDRGADESGCPYGERWPETFEVTFDPSDWTRLDGKQPTPFEIEQRLAQDQPILLADNLGPNAGYHYDYGPYPYMDEGADELPLPPAPVVDPSASRAIRTYRWKSPADPPAHGRRDTTFVSTESRGCGCGGAPESLVGPATYPVGVHSLGEVGSLEELWKDIFRPEIPIFRPHSREALAEQSDKVERAEHATTAEQSEKATDNHSGESPTANRIGHIAVDWNPSSDRVESRRVQIDLVFEARKLRLAGRPREAAAKLARVTQFDFVEPHEFYVLAYDLHRQGHVGLAHSMLGMAMQWSPSHFQRSRLERYQGHSRIWLEETQDILRWRWESAAKDNEKRREKLTELRQRLDERWWQTRVYTPDEVDLEAIRSNLLPESDWDPADDEYPAEPAPQS